MGAGPQSSFHDLWFYCKCNMLINVNRTIVSLWPLICFFSFIYQLKSLLILWFWILAATGQDRVAHRCFKALLLDSSDEVFLTLDTRRRHSYGQSIGTVPAKWSVLWSHLITCLFNWFWLINNATKELCAKPVQSPNFSLNNFLSF